MFICNSGWTRHSTEGQELRSTNECDIQREKRLFPRHKGTNMRKTRIWKIPGHLSGCWRRKCGIDEDSEFAISAMGQSRASYRQLGLKTFINWLFVGYIAAPMSTIRLKLESSRAGCQIFITVSRPSRPGLCSTDPPCRRRPPMRPGPSH